MKMCILKRPFPLITKFGDKVIISVIISLFVYVFLWVFQPFGIRETSLNVPVFLSGFFLITLLVTLFSNIIFPVLMKSFFNNEKWNIARLLLFMFFQILVISVLNWLYTNSFELEINKTYHFFSFVFFTMSVAFFPVVFFIVFVERYLNSKHRALAGTLSENMEQASYDEKDRLLDFVSENLNENFSISISDFLCAKSEGNYVNIYYYKDKDVETRMIRTSLIKLEKQFENYENIVRCHRSFLVNINAINNVSGNARNYSFHIDKLDFPIPVSRNFSKEILAHLSRNKT